MVSCENLAHFRLWILDRDLLANEDPGGVFTFPQYGIEIDLSRFYTWEDAVKHFNETVQDMYGPDKRSELRKSWDTQSKAIDGATYLVTAVELPSGAIEIATNCQDLKTKAQYITQAYDERMRLKTNSEVEMIGFMIV